MKIPRWRLGVYVLVVLLGFAIALPSVLPRATLDALPDWVPARQVALGLDLRGGSHLVLRIDESAVAAEAVGDMADTAEAALAGAGIAGGRVRAVEGGVLAEFPTRAVADAARRVLAAAIPATGSTFAISGRPDFAIAPEGATALRLTLTDEALAARRSAALNQSVEIVRRRVDEAGVAEPSIQRVGGDRIMVQLPGVSDPVALRALLGSTAKLTFHRVAEEGAAGVPRGFRVLPGEDGARYLVEVRPVLQGDRLADAGASFSAETREPVVRFRFDVEGARRFGELTQELTGRPLAIVLDGRVVSAPVIREPILAGTGEISGGFTVDETATLAALLRAGALPAPLEVIEERTVGADLGEDAIRMGAWTGLAGFALVCLVMVGLYGVWGLVANAALAINVVLTLAALTVLGATLTLPGIAGIILGLGLAVDANVLINERIREETRRGRSAAAAVQAGFDRAYRAIVDSNLTTLIATVLLFAVGSGAVRGFAVTMALGILISLFTAVAVVRAVMDVHLRVNRPKTMEIPPLLPLGTGAEPQFRFMRMRRVGLAVSLVLSLTSVGLAVKPGLDTGIDFRGGILLEARAEGMDLAALREGLAGLGLGDVGMQGAGGEYVLVRIEAQPGGEAAQTAAAERAKAAIVAMEQDATFERVEIVGPRVSDELAAAGILAVIGASLAMLAYIWVRFEWPFAVGAIATLVLDVTKTVGFLALTGLDFGLTAVAALLTLIGYSVNDKVVVYDRMRENMRLYKAMPLRELIDLSINQTLWRSIFTSATALAAMLPMAVWGGDAVQSFAIPMVFGIVVAASSSIFIAAPILLFLGDWRRRNRPAPDIAPGEGVIP